MYLDDYNRHTWIRQIFLKIWTKGIEIAILEEDKCINV
jgi:hypothetical protein